MLKKIRIIATGGTIASKAQSKTATVGYAPSAFGIENILESVPGIEQLAEVSAEQLFSKQSPNFTDEDLIILGKRIQELLEKKEVDGIVVTMGTDTMEEVAFFLNLTLKTDKPVVITGAMRPAGVISADGPLNIYNAVLTAAAEESCSKGVVVAMDDHIISARDVMKCSGFKTDAFRGGDYGVIGTVRNGEVEYFYTSTKRHTTTSAFDIRQIESLPLVEIVYMYEGCSDRLFRAAAKEAKGIVTAGFGNGAIHLDILAFYRTHSAEKLPVLVRCNRVPFGGALGDYGHFDEEIGSLPSNLSPQKARLLLSLALGSGQNIEEIRKTFKEY